MGQQAGKKKKRHDRKTKRTRQKNKRGDSKVEPNDSLEIRDKGETSDIPGLSSGIPPIGCTRRREAEQEEERGGKKIAVVLACACDRNPSTFDALRHNQP